MLQIILLVLGILMIVSPKTALKKEYKEDYNRLQKVKITGGIITVLVVVWIGFSILKVYLFN